MKIIKVFYGERRLSYTLFFPQIQFQTRLRQAIRIAPAIKAAKGGCAAYCSVQEGVGIWPKTRPCRTQAIGGRIAPAPTTAFAACTAAATTCASGRSRRVAARLAPTRTAASTAWPAACGHVCKGRAATKAVPLGAWCLAGSRPSPRAST